MLSVKWNVVGASMLAMAIGCSARGGSGTNFDPDASMGDTPVSTNDGATPPMGISCSAVCGRLTGSACAAAMVNCMTTCQTTLSNPPAGCAAQVSALGACAMTAPSNCTAGATFPFSGCDAQLMAYATCVSSPPPPPRDSGPPPTDAVTPPIDTGPSTGACAACDRVGAMCGADVGATCRTSCATLQTSVPTRCSGQVTTLLACAQGSPIACSGAFPFSACTSQYAALTSCASGGGGPDAGPCAATSCGTCTAGSSCGWCNGRCYEGSSSGPNGATCVDMWAWTSSDCP